MVSVVHSPNTLGLYLLSFLVHCTKQNHQECFQQKWKREISCLCSVSYWLSQLKWSHLVILSGGPLVLVKIICRWECYCPKTFMKTNHNQCGSWQSQPPFCNALFNSYAATYFHGWLICWLLIIFSRSWSVFSCIKCQNILNIINQCLPKTKMKSSNGLYNEEVKKSENASEAGITESWLQSTVKIVGN